VKCYKPENLGGTIQNQRTAGRIFEKMEFAIIPGTPT
jgi:hypothetical protein